MQPVEQIYKIISELPTSLESIESKYREVCIAHVDMCFQCVSSVQNSLLNLRLI